MEVMDRAAALKDEFKARRLESRADHAEQEIDRLRMENRTLKEEVDRDKDRIDQLLEGLQDVISPGGSKHRVRRLMTLSVAAGGAYVMGAKAGRERYQQIMEKVRGMRDRSQDDWDRFPETPGTVGNGSSSITGSSTTFTEPTTGKSKGTSGSTGTPSEGPSA
jgi:hypothetical protein